MRIELYVAIMAGCVLSVFVMVSEIVLLRRRLAMLRKRLIHYYLTGRVFSFYLGIFALAAFFLVQPLIVAYLVMMSLDSLNPHFSVSVFKQLREALSISG
jgi:hypothetical protein